MYRTNNDEHCEAILSMTRWNMVVNSIDTFILIPKQHYRTIASRIWYPQNNISAGSFSYHTEREKSLYQKVLQILKNEWGLHFMNHYFRKQLKVENWIWLQNKIFTGIIRFKCVWSSLISVIPKSTFNWRVNQWTQIRGTSTQSSVAIYLATELCVDEKRRWKVVHGQIL